MGRVNSKNMPIEKVLKKSVLIKAAVLFPAAAAALAILYCHEPLKTAWLPKCPLYVLTHLHCPGCGATRAVYALLHGDWLTAFRNNILLFPLLATAGLMILRPELAKQKYVAITVAVTVILFTVLRNLPFYPFTLLAPLAGK